MKVFKVYIKVAKFNKYNSFIALAKNKDDALFLVLGKGNNEEKDWGEMSLFHNQEVFIDEIATKKRGIIHESFIQG